MFEINFILFQFYYIGNGWDHKTTLEAAPCLAALLQWAAMGYKALNRHNLLQPPQSLQSLAPVAMLVAHCNS